MRMRVKEVERHFGSGPSFRVMAVHKVKCGIIGGW